ncbi:hypothetical protein [Saccharibacillus deserti]|uniref:hypothetical protein n=1 Tax=Saccharibacillus deserti TaxID=1634444 RepID=UPI001551E3B3|nr:hypothetical protein [Saccharibacillus deserti]
MTEDGIYESVWNGVLRDPDTVTDEVIATVRYKLDENVHDSSYRSKPGDAAFLEKGTKLYRVKGFAAEDVLAVRADDQIGGYKLYAREQVERLPEESFQAALRAEPSSVSIYRLGEIQPLRVVSGEAVQPLIRLLQYTTYTPNYRSNVEGKDPTFYKVVFDTGEPVLYTFMLADDGTNVMFREGYQTDDGIRDYLTPLP